MREGGAREGPRHGGGKVPATADEVRVLGTRETCLVISVGGSRPRIARWSQRVGGVWCGAGGQEVTFPGRRTR